LIIRPWIHYLKSKKYLLIATNILHRGVKGIMGKDLRNFLDVLHREMPQEIIHIDREVSPVYECAAIVSRLEKEGKFPVVIFEKVKGSNYRLMMNMHASVKRMARALEISLENLTAEYRVLEEQRIKPKRVTDGPVKEIKLTGDHVNLNVLPITTLHELDAGPYIDGIITWEYSDICYRVKISWVCSFLKLLKHTTFIRSMKGREKRWRSLSV